MKELGFTTALELREQELTTTEYDGGLSRYQLKYLLATNQI